MCLDPFSNLHALGLYFIYLLCILSVYFCIHLNEWL